MQNVPSRLLLWPGGKEIAKGPSLSSSSGTGFEVSDDNATNLKATNLKNCLRSQPASARHHTTRSISHFGARTRATCTTATEKSSIRGIRWSQQVRIDHADQPLPRPRQWSREPERNAPAVAAQVLRGEHLRGQNFACYTLLIIPRGRHRAVLAVASSESIMTMSA